MIIPDTNVVSELTRQAPSRSVLLWFEQQQRTALQLASPVLAELLFGLEVLPPGKRKTLLEIAVSGAVETWFGTRLVSFDRRAAEAYARIMADARASGRPIGIIDGQIAASKNATVATRDTAPFAAAGVPTINPWQA